MPISRWENCVAHYDAKVLEFFEEYFADKSRKCLLIGGAGFDPRSADIIKHLSTILGTRLNIFLIKEERPTPDQRLVDKANKNVESMSDCCKNITIKHVNILAKDNAVVGGRNVIKCFCDINISDFTDVVVDFSALSMGISFPITKYIYEFARNHNEVINVHLTVASNPDLDVLIESSPNDRVSDVHGFMRSKLHGTIAKARLWLPQLSKNKLKVLRDIHREIKPHDTCPILPFPSEQPKRNDEMVIQLFSSIRDNWGGGPLDNEWGLDPRNFMYADERKPLDIYRSILRLADEREPVFNSYGGSQIILSPLGSKIPAIGALMAAMERDFPVVYVESLAYNMNQSQVSILNDSDSKLAHIWLFGDAYLRDTEGKAKI